MTAEQALEAGKDLTFEKVWAAIIGVSERQAKSDAQMAWTDATMARTDAQMARTEAMVDKMSRGIEELRKTLGNMGYI
jgi:septal ring factor EnvC (AmiA/AmiB activator)